jgi:hypothetical protein
MQKFSSRLAVTLVLIPLLFCSCQSFDDSDSFGANVSASRSTVNSLAHDVDELEEHIEKYGSVVVKQPDVWGQARLTKIRDDFETNMANELGTFTRTLQGSSFASDQAYFADAMALSMAASGTQQSVRPPKTVINNSTVGSGQASSDPATPTGRAIDPLGLPTAADTQNTFAAFGSVSGTPGISRTAIPTQTPLGFGSTAAIAIEPTVYLEQKARYLNALNELRRINEGDDTADAPGYSLNLVRLPVSILPGKQTDIGYGAEITMSLTPHLSEELLPTTFRNLVLNDVVDQIGFPTTQFINNPENNVYFDQRNTRDVVELFKLIDEVRFDIHTKSRYVRQLTELRYKPSLQPLLARVEWSWVGEYIDARQSRWENLYTRTVLGSRKDVLQKRVAEIKAGMQEDSPDELSIKQKELDELQDSDLEAEMSHDPRIANELDTRSRIGSHFERMNNSIAIPATKSRRARMPFPPSQLLEVFGNDFTYSLAVDAYRVFAKERIARPAPDSTKITIHLPDVQGYLQEELAASHKLLAHSSNLDLWMFCSPELVDAVRSHKVDELRRMRSEFKVAMEGKSLNVGSLNTTVTALAWATIVESALLTDQLILDMREATSAKGYAASEYQWRDYYYPNPSAEVRQSFNDYVRIRWPIHVFALDPVQQQQNIASTFSSRREMQLALSLAFVNGQVSAQNMMRFARRLEFDFATIDINGTSVGFSHGNETFGWRYYPRFQTPDIDSNATVLFRDLLVGGPNRNQLLKQRRLEPGVRECDAVVIMPSFVPYATLDTTSNWFKLTNPKKKDLDSQYAMKLSHRVKKAQNFAACVTDSQLYRDGDVHRLENKIKQLETRLPMQSTMVQVPYENTLGGFAMFNTGITDLAPELTGWYGSPSVNPGAPTTVFLVGNHFSVRQTVVLAGGQPVTGQQLLSRQVVQVTIPAKTALVGDEFQKFVDVNLATPYGVTQHLLIPVYAPETPPAAKGPSWKSGDISLAFVYGGLGIASPPATDPNFKPATLLIQPGDDVDPAKYESVVITVKADDKITPKDVPLATAKYDAGQKGYVVQGADIAAAILGAVATTFGPEASYPPVAFSADTSLTFKSSQGLPDISKKAINTLNISWVKGGK